MNSRLRRLAVVGCLAWLSLTSHVDADATAYYDVSVSGNHVTITFYVSGGMVEEHAYCTPPGIWTIVQWPDSLLQDPMYYVTDTGLNQDDISREITQTQYGSGGCYAPNEQNVYRVTFQFDEPTPGTHTFDFRLQTTSGETDTDYYVPYTVN